MIVLDVSIFMIFNDSYMCFKRWDCVVWVVKLIGNVCSGS